MTGRILSKRRFVLAAAATIVLLGLFAQSNRVRSVSLLFPTIAGFSEVTPGVWAERGMPVFERAQLVQTVETATGSISRFFGRASGHAVVLACFTERCYRACGGIGPFGTTFFGDHILLSRRGMSSVKLAHELSHVELATRVGAVRALFKVPQWFDEGLAVLASDDPDFSEARWLATSEDGTRAPPLEELSTLRGWLAVNKDLSYGTARHEVARWYARAGRTGLDRLFTALRTGEKLQRAYATAQQETP